MSTGIFRNTQWNIHANNFDGTLVIIEDNRGNVSGIIFDNPLSAINVIGNSISFVRTIGPNYTQTFMGTAVLGDGGTDASLSLMGMFTENKSGKVSMPYLWSSDPLGADGGFTDNG